MRNSSINWMFLLRISIQNQSKSPITQQRRNKSKYLTWNSIKWKFLIALDISSATARAVSDLLKVSSILSDVNRQKTCTWSRRPETIPEIKKKAISLYVINKPNICKFFKGFTNHRKKLTGRLKICIPFPRILEYRDHRWVLLRIWKTRFHWRHVEEFS